MSAVRSTYDEFENVVIAELDQLRKTERALQKMYPCLKARPQLREVFLRQLADMQYRAHRLDAVLNPVEAIETAPGVPAAAQPSVA